MDARLAKCSSHCNDGRKVKILKQQHRSLMISTVLGLPNLVIVLQFFIPDKKIPIISHHNSKMPSVEPQFFITDKKIAILIISNEFFIPDRKTESLIISKRRKASLPEVSTHRLVML